MNTLELEQSKLENKKLQLQIDEFDHKQKKTERSKSNNRKDSNTFKGVSDQACIQGDQLSQIIDQIR